MLKFSQYFLTEAKKKSGKNLHMEHIEDLVFLEGMMGLKKTVSFFNSLTNMLSGKSSSSVPKAGLTTKFDGAPAIFCGINPDNKKFFVGLKAVFGTREPKICYTEDDVDRFYPDGGELNAKIKAALEYLPELGIKQVLQGELMYTSKKDIKAETIDGERYITFRPNTITYAIPYDSTLGQKIMMSKIGVVFHTTYKGSTFADMQAHFGADISNLTPSKNVWFRDAQFVDTTGVATFTENETKDIKARVKTIESLIRQVDSKVINKIAENEFLQVPIMAWNNRTVIEGRSIQNIPQHIQGFIIQMDEKLNKNILDAKKEDTKKKRLLEKNTIMSFWKSRNTINTLTIVYKIFQEVTSLKLIFVRKFEQIRDIGTFVKKPTGYEVIKPEGFVAIDHLGTSAVKLVDRLKFSHLNFTLEKDWDK